MFWRELIAYEDNSELENIKIEYALLKQLNSELTEKNTLLKQLNTELTEKNTYLKEKLTNETNTNINTNSNKKAMLKLLVTLKRRRQKIVFKQKKSTQTTRKNLF